MNKGFLQNLWVRCSIALLSGSLLTLAFAPFNLLPVIFVAFPTLLWLVVNAHSKKQAFLLGFLFAFGHHVSALYWIANSLMVDAEKFAWMVPFAVSLIPAILSFFAGLAALVIYILPVRNSLLPSMAALIWTGAEYGRAHIPVLEFPWNILGYSFLSEIHIAQMAHIFGLYSLTFIVALFGFLPYGVRTVKQGVITGCLIVISYAGMYGYGVGRLEQQTQFRETRLRLVQANIPQAAGLTPEQRFAQMEKHIKLSMQDKKVPDFLIWSESSIPFILNMEPGIQRVLSESLPKQTVLISGAMRLVEGEKRNFYNTIYVMKEGKVLATYDKHNLVPFGEFVPFRKLLPFVEKIADGIGDFSRGDGTQTIVIEGKPEFSPLICYEAIFPGDVVDKKSPPKWLLNLTNDAWFGDSIGPHQHLAMARMRAIEEGLPLVRVAGTGISAVVDGYGRIIQQIPLNHEGVMDVKLPLPSFQ